MLERLLRVQQSPYCSPDDEQRKLAGKEREREEREKREREKSSQMLQWGLKKRIKNKLKKHWQLGTSAGNQA